MAKREYLRDSAKPTDKDGWRRFDADGDGVRSGQKRFWQSPDGQLRIEIRPQEMEMVIDADTLSDEITHRKYKPGARDLYGKRIPVLNEAMRQDFTTAMAAKIKGLRDGNDATRFDHLSDDAVEVEAIKLTPPVVEAGETMSVLDWRGKFASWVYGLYRFDAERMREVQTIEAGKIVTTLEPWPGFVLVELYDTAEEAETAAQALMEA